MTIGLKFLTHRNSKLCTSVMGKWRNCRFNNYKNSDRRRAVLSKSSTRFQWSLRYRIIRMNIEKLIVWRISLHVRTVKVRCTRAIYRFVGELLKTLSDLPSAIEKPRLELSDVWPQEGAMVSFTPCLLPNSDPVRHHETYQERISLDHRPHSNRTSSLTHKDG